MVRSAFSLPEFPVRVARTGQQIEHTKNAIHVPRKGLKKTDMPRLSVSPKQVQLSGQNGRDRQEPVN